jgi:hypothetical protein
MTTTTDLNAAARRLNAAARRTGPKGDVARRTIRLAKAARSAGDVARVRNLVAGWAVENPAPAPRRNAAQIAADRDALLATVTDGWERAPEGARQTDLDALVSEGRIERNVRVEYDRQTGRGDKFGGAAVCQRRRAYYRLSEVAA